MVDWTKPIELDTVPPRPAKFVEKDDGDNELPMLVEADWHDDGGKRRYWVSADGAWRNLPRVRNVAAPDIAAHDIATELAEALRPFAAAAHRIEYYDGEHYDAPLYAMRETDALRELLDDINGEPVRVQHLNRARAALAKYEASK